MTHRRRGVPATAIGTAADRTRIENIQRLTRAIGDHATYLTRGIAGAACLVADALNPALLPTPTPMASPKQKQLLLALETGVKLHDALREPGMPSKMLLQEWLDNPEFSREYDTATEKGTAIRLGKLTAGRKPEAPAAPEPAAPRALPIVTDENTHPLSKALDENTLLPAPLPPKPEAAAQSTRQKEVDVQTHILVLIRNGTKPTSLLTGIPGYNGVKLAAWRKEPLFLANYEAAKIEGAKARGEVMDVLTVPETPAEVEPTEAVAEAEPAPNQSEPAPNTPKVYDGRSRTAITSELGNTPNLILMEPGCEQAGGAVQENRYATVVQVSDWLSLEEAKELARQRAAQLNKSVFVVERVCVAEHVVQIRG